jgi:hypothetical protein
MWLVWVVITLLATIQYSCPLCNSMGADMKARLSFISSELTPQDPQKLTSSEGRNLTIHPSQPTSTQVAVRLFNQLFERVPRTALRAVSRNH